jgi:hypothetical protein
MPKDTSTEKVSSLWARARVAAERTPESRNRYVDLLRVVSIGAVVLGHWLLSAPYVEDGRLQLSNIFRVAPWTVWLSWGFQVMPVFFIVGGYSNAASWDSARSKGRNFGDWIAARLHRLVWPVVPLVIAWSAIAVIGHQSGVSSELVSVGSVGALRPVWFLSVYIMIVVTAPISHWAWSSAGIGAFWILALCAVAVDIAGFAGGFSGLRWVNYAFVWLAVHQLGYFWRAGGFASPLIALAWGAGGLAMLVLLTTVAGYPIGMVTVPGVEMSNSRPPTIALIALAAFHVGVLLSIEAPVRRWLGKVRPWAATILVNRSIMTIYLWHATVMVLITGLLDLLGGVGLTLQPGTWQWWITRPVWLVALAIVLVVASLFLSPFEQMTRKRELRPLPVWQAIGGAVMVCYGLAQLALHGIYGDGVLGLRLWVVLLIILGAGLVSYPAFLSRLRR